MITWVKSLGLVYLSGIFGVGRVKYRPTIESRKLPNGPFTSLVVLGNIRPIPDLPDPVSFTLRFSQPRGRPRVLAREKGRRGEATAAMAAGKGDGGGERTHKSQRRRRGTPPATGPR
jgi:hypothetical protein